MTEVSTLKKSKGVNVKTPPSFLSQWFLTSILQHHQLQTLGTANCIHYFPCIFIHSKNNELFLTLQTSQIINFLVFLIKFFSGESSFFCVWFSIYGRWEKKELWIDFVCHFPLGDKNHLQSSSSWIHNFQQVGTSYRKRDSENIGGVHNPKFKEALDIPDDILFIFFDKHTDWIDFRILNAQTIVFFCLV